VRECRWTEKGGGCNTCRDRTSNIWQNGWNGFDQTVKLVSHILAGDHRQRMRETETDEGVALPKREKKSRGEGAENGHCEEMTEKEETIALPREVTWKQQKTGARPTKLGKRAIGGPAPAEGDCGG